MSQFTEGELEVMKILWEHGPMTPPEIQSLFEREIKNPALRSYLTILVEKGHLSRHRKGKAYIYSVKTPRDSAFKSTYRNLVETFFNGSSETLMMQLIKTENWTEEELLEFRKLAEESSDSEEEKNDNVP